LQYELRISDAITNQPLHIENGMWLLLNDTQDPQVLSVARQAAVPHGVSVLALGGYSITSDPPQIPNNTAVPDPGTGMPLGYLDPYLNPPPGVNPSNPNKTLQDVVKDQTIVETVTLSVSTASAGGIVDIPFLVEHANATQFTATYWIETVQDKATGAEFEQLQYSQQTDIRFLLRLLGTESGIHYPCQPEQEIIAGRRSGQECRDRLSRGSGRSRASSVHDEGNGPSHVIAPEVVEQGSATYTGLEAAAAAECQAGGREPEAAPSHRSSPAPRWPPGPGLVPWR
jgi:hypothetical protein